MLDRRTFVRRSQNKGEQGGKWELSYSDSALLKQWVEEKTSFKSQGSLEDDLSHKYLHKAGECFEKWKKA